MKEGIPLHFWASMISGFCTTAASMPVDIVKTRIQNMRVVNGVPEYKVWSWGKGRGELGASLVHGLNISIHPRASWTW
jgi:hypothetical protein